MKKSVILSIVVIYVLAIVIVGFLGMKMRVYDEEKYIAQIICVSDGYTDYDETEELSKDYKGYIIKPFVEGLKVEIRCEVILEKSDERIAATYENIDYIYDTSVTDYQIIKNSDGTATIEFFGTGCASITIRSKDNKHTAIKIQVYAF